MFRFEELALGYFLVLALATSVSGATRHRIILVVLLTTGMCLFVLLVSAAAPGSVRAWLAHAYLVAGYWTPALLVPRESAQRFEAWLIRTDAVWRQHAVPPPRWAVALLEFAYLLCYPIVPVAFATVWIRGTYADVDRFWVAVLASGFLSYGCLPWLTSRPPRVTDGSVRDRHPMADVNIAILGCVGHGLNTFPSGHVAVSVAAALSVWSVWAPGGVILGVIATGIAISAVAGRYHYLVDVILGAAIGTGAALASQLR